MGAHFQIKPGPVGGGAANASYITRSQAAAGESSAVYHNAPEKIENADSWHETKVRFRSWAERTKAVEKAKHGNRAGQPRTHYRAIISYEDEIPTEAAREDAKELLEEEFEEARAVAVVHQDTEHTHVHVWMSARREDGKKVHIGNGDLEEMHARMDEIYERRMGVQSRNAEKVREAKEFKREFRRELSRELNRGLEREGGAIEKHMRRWAEANRPERATPPGPEVYREREERLLGEGALEGAEASLEEVQEQEAEKAEEIISQSKNRLESSYERQQAGAEEAEPRANGGDAPPQRGERKVDFREPGASERSEGADRGRSGGEGRGPGKEGRGDGGESRGDREPGEQRAVGSGGDDRSGGDSSDLDGSDRSWWYALVGQGGDSPPEVGNDRGSQSGGSSPSGGSVADRQEDAQAEAERWVESELLASELVTSELGMPLEQKDLSGLTGLQLNSRSGEVLRRKSAVESLKTEKEIELLKSEDAGELLEAKVRALERRESKLEEARSAIEQERQKRPSKAEKRIERSLKEARRQRKRKDGPLTSDERKRLELLDRARAIYEGLSEEQQESFRGRLAKKGRLARKGKYLPTLERALDPSRKSLEQYDEEMGRGAFGSSEGFSGPSEEAQEEARGESRGEAQEGSHEEEAQDQGRDQGRDQSRDQSRDESGESSGKDRDRDQSQGRDRGRGGISR